PSDLHLAPTDRGGTDRASLSLDSVPLPGDRRQVPRGETECTSALRRREIHMPRAAHSTALLAALVLTAIGGASTASATQDHKVRLCHGTASATNPYVLITVDVHALKRHFDGDAPGHGQNNAPDFVLADDASDCSGPGEGGAGGGE